MQAGSDLSFLEFTEIAIGGIKGIRSVARGEDVAEFAAAQLRQDRAAERLAPSTAQLYGFPVLINQSLEFPQVAMESCTTKRWGEVIEDHRLGTALGLGALTRVIDDERIEVGDRA